MRFENDDLSSFDILLLPNHIDACQSKSRLMGSDGITTPTMTSSNWYFQGTGHIVGYVPPSPEAELADSCRLGG